MNRLQAIKYTMAHRRALNKLAKEHGFYFPFHDLDKLFLYPIFGKKLTGKIHRLYSRHHERPNKYGVLDIKNKYEAAFDWESSRFTKPDKQETAWEYWLRACPEVDMFWIFAELDMLPKDKNYIELQQTIFAKKEMKMRCA